VVLGVVVGAFALLRGVVPLIVWSVAIGGVAGAGIWWERQARRGVELDVAFRPRRVFAGEPVTMVIRVTNPRGVPLPVVRLAAWLPEGLAPPAELRSGALRGYRRRVALPGRSVLTLELPVVPARRGEYQLERVIVELADPFDLVPVVHELRPDASLLVIPEPRIGIPVEVLRRLPFGVPARAARFFEERERFAGVRPYEAGDPLNRIHWRLTAHSGELQTKLFEPTRSADVLLALDLAMGEPFWDAVFPEIAEDTIGWATFLARRAISLGWRVGLAANTHARRGRGPLRVPASAVKGHEGVLFAALARMPNEPTSDLAPILREVGRPLTRGTVTVVLTPRPGPRLQAEIAGLRHRGIQVVQVSPVEARLAKAGSP
jgi:uncharacterized protein (DUF58 family)